MSISIVHKYYKYSYFTFKITPAEHFSEVNVYELLSDENDPLEWQDKNCGSHPSPTSNFEDAELLFTVRVKWDQCANWEFSQYKHTCIGVDSIVEYGYAMRDAYELGWNAIEGYKDE